MPTPVRTASPTTHRRRRAAAAIATSLAATVATTTVAATPAQAASPAELPVTVSNHTGRSGAVYLYVLGVDLETNRLGYVDAAGTFTPWSLPGSPVPSPAPDVSIPGPANGSAVTLKFPKNLSGRVYFSFGRKLSFGLVSAGLVQPAPWNPSDKNADTLFDWSEFTYNNDGLWLNSSQVDQFAVPHAVTVTDGTGATSRTGDLVSGGRQKVIDQIEATPGFSKSVQTGSDGQVLRVLAPSKATDGGLMDPDYLDAAIDRVWGAYTTKTVTVTPFEDQPNLTYVGRSQGGQLVFTDDSGRQVASFAKPTTANVWNCDGALAAPNDLVVGPIARTLCAAMHRGTLGSSTAEPISDPSRFYQTSSSDLYSKIIHANMADGKAYGFAFDDVTHQESLVHSGDPQRAGISLDPFN